MLVYLSGMAMAASLIVAIGPQNALLIRFGLARQSGVFAIAAIYVAIDATLIAVGALGVGSAVARVPLLRFAFSLFAAGFFAFYGGRSLVSAMRRSARLEIAPAGTGYATAVLVSVANPAVIFDTIVLVGGMAAQHEQLAQRAVFSAGAVTASALWFAALSLLSYTAGRYVTGASVWRTLDLIVGVLMLVLAGTLFQDAAQFAAARWTL